MAGVKIDSGELPSAEGVAEGHPLFQVIVRWQRVAGSFHEDCRFLKQMIEETDRLRLWEKNVGGFTYKDRDEFLRKKVLINYELTEQDMIEIVSMLKHDEPDKVSAKLTGRLRPHGGDRRSEQAKDQPDNVSLKHGNSADYITCRLERDGHTELAEKVRTKTMSARAAAIEAGIVKPATPLDRLRKAWKAANPEERETFLEEIRDRLGTDRDRSVPNKT